MLLISNFAIGWLLFGLREQAKHFTAMLQHSGDFVYIQVLTY
jgi:hypothetical protein